MSMLLLSIVVFIGYAAFVYYKSFSNDLELQTSNEQNQRKAIKSIENYLSVLDNEDLDIDQAREQRRLAIQEMREVVEMSQKPIAVNEGGNVVRLLSASSKIRRD